MNGNEENGNNKTSKSLENKVKEIQENERAAKCMPKQKNPKKIGVKNGTELKELHRAVIDTYFYNGFNGVRAVLEHKPELSYNGASALFNAIKKSNKDYIQTKQNELKEVTDISTQAILSELISHAYVDASKFIGLDPNQIDQLTPAERRCIQAIRHKTRRYKQRDGTEVEDETIEFRLVDKQRALEMLSKYIGLFEADNKQKAPKINLTKVDAETLNVLNNVLLRGE